MLLLFLLIAISGVFIFLKHKKSVATKTTTQPENKKNVWPMVDSAINRAAPIKTDTTGNKPLTLMDKGILVDRAFKHTDSLIAGLFVKQKVKAAVGDSLSKYLTALKDKLRETIPPECLSQTFVPDSLMKIAGNKTNADSVFQSLPRLHTALKADKAKMLDCLFNSK